MTVLDTNIVAIVLPTVARNLGATFADVEWVISTYVLCFASLLLPAGAIADRFGRRKVFLGGIGVFMLASLLCGAAPSAPTLYLARAAQGVGAAFLLAPALAIIGHAFHGEAERTKAWAVWGAMMGLTMVLAPILGGIIAYALGWRWAFYINIPVGAALATAVVCFIDESCDEQARTLDPLGILFFAATMFGVTWALINGQARGWSSTATILGLCIGAASLAAFIVSETRQTRPMLDLSLFRVPRFVGAVIAMFGYAASAQVMASLLPLYLQNGVGRPPLEAGFAMLPFALAMLVFPQVGRWLGGRLSSHQVLTLGLGTVCLGNLVTAWAAGDARLLFVIVGMTILGSGGGLLNGETQKAIMGSVPRGRAGMASGISTTARFSGILLGFAVLSAVLATAARSTLVMNACAFDQTRCSQAAQFASLVVAGDVPKSVALLSHDNSAAILNIAHRGYAAGFSAALFVAAFLAGLATVLVAFLMRPVWSKSSHQLESA